MWDSREVEDIRRQCIYYFAWILVKEKAVFKVGVVFAHSQSKTTRRRFRALFATVSTQQKGVFCVNMWRWMKHGSTTSLWSQINGQLSGQKHMKALQSDQRRKHQQVRFWPLFLDAQGILFIDSLEMGRTISSEYYLTLLVCLKEEIAKKWPQMKTMHCVTSQSQQWQNYMNCTSNYFCTYPILQIWTPVTTGCLQTSKEWSRERDLVPMKKWYWKLKRIVRPKRNHSTKKASNC